MKSFTAKLVGGYPSYTKEIQQWADEHNVNLVCGLAELYSLLPIEEPCLLIENIAVLQRFHVPVLGYNYSRLQFTKTKLPDKVVEQEYSFLLLKETYLKSTVLEKILQAESKHDLMNRSKPKMAQAIKSMISIHLPASFSSQDQKAFVPRVQKQKKQGPRYGT